MTLLCRGNHNDGLTIEGRYGVISGEDVALSLTAVPSHPEVVAGHKVPEGQSVGGHRPLEDQLGLGVRSGGLDPESRRAGVAGAGGGGGWLGLMSPQPAGTPLTPPAGPH